MPITVDEFHFLGNAESFKLATDIVQRELDDIVKAQARTQKAMLSATSATELQVLAWKQQTDAARTLNLEVAKLAISQAKVAASRDSRGRFKSPTDTTPAGVSDKAAASTIIAQLAMAQLATNSEKFTEVVETKIPSVNKKIATTGKQIATANKATQRWTLSMQSLVRLLAVQVLHRAISSSVQAIREGIGASAELLVKIAEIETISQNVQLTTVAWAAGLREVSDEFGFEILDAAEGAYQALSNQIAEGAESLEFLHTAGRLSLATVSTLSDSVLGLTAIINSYNLAESDAERISAQFFKTIELGRVRMNEMSKSIGAVSILASQLGINSEELFASIAALSKQGLPFNQTMTQLRGIMISLIKPTGAMSDLLRDVGVESGEAFFEMSNLGELFDILRDRTGGISTELAKFVPRIRGISGAAGLIKDNAAEYDEALNEILHSTSNFNVAVEKVANNSGKQLQIIGQNIKNFFLVDIGQGLVEGLVKFNNEVIGFEKLVTRILQAVTGLAIVSGLALITKAVYALAVAVGTLGLVSLPFTAIAVGVALVGTAIGLAVAEITDLLFQAKDQQKDDALELLRSLRETAEQEAEGMKQIIAQHVDAVDEIISGMLADATAGWNKVIDDAPEFMDGLKESTSDLADVISDKLNVAIKETSKLFKEAEQEGKALDKLATKLDELKAKRELKNDLRSDDGKPGKQLETLREAIAEAQTSLRKSNTAAEIETAIKRITNLEDQAQKIRDATLKENDKGVKKQIEDIKDRAKLEVEIAAQTGVLRNNANKELKRIDEDIKKATKEKDDAELVKLKREREDTLDTAKQEIFNLKRKLQDEGGGSASKAEVAKRRKIIAAVEKLQIEAEDRFTEHLRVAKELRIAFDLEIFTKKKELRDKEIKELVQKEARELAQRTFDRTGDTVKDALESEDPSKIFHALVAREKAARDLIAANTAIDPTADVSSIRSALVSEQAAADALEQRQLLAIDAADTKVEVDKVRLLLVEVAARIAALREKEAKFLGDIEGGNEDPRLKVHLDTVREKLQVANDTRRTLLQLLIAGIKEFDTELAKTFEATAQKTRSLTELFEALEKQVGDTITAVGAFDKAAMGHVPAEVNPLDEKALGGVAQSGSDTIRAVLSSGEFVMNKAASGRFHSQLLAMNSFRGFEGGGSVTNNVGDVNVNMHASGNTEVDVQRIGHSLRREIRRGTLSLS